MRIGMSSILLAFLFLCPALPGPVSTSASSTINSSSSVVQMMSTLGPVSSSTNLDLLKIGASASFTSQDSVYFNQSSHLYNGWSLFVQWVNVGRSVEQGGASGVKIGNQSFLVELAAVEDFSSPTLAAQAATSLVHHSQNSYNYSADFLFGPYSSPLTAATANVTDAANVLLLSASSLHDSQDHCDNTELLLALQPPPASFAQSLFQTLLWVGAQSVAIVVDDVADSYCHNATEMQALAALYNVTLGFYAVDGGSGGGEEEQEDVYLSSLRGILSSLQSSSSPVDVVAGCPPRDQGGNPYLQTRGMSVCVQLPLMARNLSYSPSGLLFLNCDFEDPATAAALGTTGDYLLALVPWHPSPLIREEEREEGGAGLSAEDFYFRYVAQYKSTPSYHAAAAFASGTLLQSALEGLEQPQQWASYQDGQQLADIYKTNGTFYPSIFGNVSFNACGESLMELLVLQGQKQEQDQESEGSHFQSEVVFPARYAAPVPPSSSSSSSSLLVYPAPSWATRNCEEATQHCAGHGTCSEEAEGTARCHCSDGYYGGVDPDSCDTLCLGDLHHGYCIESQTFYIGGTYGGNFAESEEHVAHMRHVVALINNKTDGWFDDDMPQVQLVLEVEDSGCDADVAEAALQTLEQWAIAESGGESALTAVVGAFCSGASMAIATQANIKNFFQISYASTNEALSDVDQYRYFTRTAASDAIQGPLLAKSLVLLGATPYLAVLHLTDSYSSSLAKAVIQQYEESGENRVLLTLPFDSDETSEKEYQDIVFKAGESGAAVILFVGYQDIAVKVFNAAALHPVLGSSQVLWVGVDAWTGLELQNTTLLPKGTIGIKPFVAHNPVTEDYIARWAALPPDEYPSLHEQVEGGSGSREVLATYSSTLVDATLALGLALQLAVDQHLDLSGASLFTEMTANVAFEGVSGQVNFDTAGDLLHPTFSLSNYRDPLQTGDEGEGEEEKGGGGGEGDWVVVGNVTETSFFVDESLLQWPGGASNASSFSLQLLPWCGAGSEPLLTYATGIYSCSPCKVGYYKSEDSRSACLACPEGAQCDDTGISVPCVEDGYWRDPAAEQHHDIGDFSAYNIYRCEVHDVCNGGCDLNNSCASDRQRESPVCGVCEGHSYMSNSYCYSCAADSLDSKGFRLAVYMLVPVAVMCFLSAVLFVNMLATPTLKKEGAGDAEQDVFISNDLIYDMAGSKHERGDTAARARGPRPEEVVAVEMTETNKQREEEDEGSRDSSARVNASGRASSSTARNIKRPSGRLGDILQRNKNNFKKLIRGGSITGKITISFLQVLTGSFLTLNLKYPSYLRQFYVDLQLNPFQPVVSTFKCADQDNHTDGNVFFLFILLSVLCPIFFLVLLLLAIVLSRLAYFKLVYPKKRPRIQNRKQFLIRQFSKTYNLSIKLYIWFCLIMYPVLSANIMGAFNCRDLGAHTGIFLRGDYSLSCQSDTYRASKIVAIIGIVFIPLGVPLFFTALIYHRHSPWLRQPSFFLHGNFLPRWRYYEVLDLVRKLMLTSIAPYVGEVDSTTQCLFLLVVDTASLVLLAFSKPYQNSRDDFLSLVLVTTECVAFLLGVVILSGIDEDDNYHTNALYASLFAWFVLDLVLVVPLSLAAKSSAFCHSVTAFGFRLRAAPDHLITRLSLPPPLPLLLQPSSSRSSSSSSSSTPPSVGSDSGSGEPAKNPLHSHHHTNI